MFRINLEWTPHINLFDASWCDGSILWFYSQNSGIKRSNKLFWQFFACRHSTILGFIQQILLRAMPSYCSYCLDFLFCHSQIRLSDQKPKLVSPVASLSFINWWIWDGGYGNRPLPYSLAILFHCAREVGGHKALDWMAWNTRVVTEYSN